MDAQTQTTQSHTQKIDYHLQQAFAHLKEALNNSVSAVLANESQTGEIGQRWEVFIKEFFGMVKQKGKESKVNLLGFVSVTKFWR